ncbi:SLC13 family permease [Arcobacter sp. FWKO B]|uniref:SLC13 family permease n=1 Tax=Arcobacter sp. FWKO B TaxID=2593672 RepID=UPI0018A45E57|nr:DASS family sodium-coupled anion symporter [Arcobacter sp. FWKO B]QOG12728.1 SLC13/DASS family transporter [Arcobacter sp. FWKO B]
MIDSRSEVKEFFEKVQFSLTSSLVKFIFSLVLSLFLAFFPDYSDLSGQAQMMLFILIFGAMLWISEAIPAFAVSLLIIGLEILLLGYYDTSFSTNSKEWESYLAPWSSPLVFLFLAGFILAAAASKTKLDLWIAKKVLFYVGNKPENIITGLMGITFGLSMFVSNTATTAMMLTILIPILKNINEDNPYQKAILLGVVVAANIGGMSTIIGTPPNAIAVGMMGDSAPSFIGWMFFAMPPAIAITVGLRYLLLKMYPSNQELISFKALRNIDHFDDSTTNFVKRPTVPSWKKTVVIIGFGITILLWLTGPIHNIPTTVISFIPIVLFTLFGIINSDDIRAIRWDVIILIIGGLTLGLGVTKTGLDIWFATHLPQGLNSIFILLIVFAYLVVFISNFMSNTAASNIMLPIVIALVSVFSADSVSLAAIAIALSASFAMALPVSTPPNAIVYSSGKLQSKDFLFIGIVIGLFGPIIVLTWLFLVI